VCAIYTGAPPYLYVRITRASPLHLLHVHTQAAEGSLIHRLPLLNNTPAPRADDPIAPVIRAVEISARSSLIFDHPPAVAPRRSRPLVSAWIEHRSGEQRSHNLPGGTNMMCMSTMLSWGQSRPPVRR